MPVQKYMLSLMVVGSSSFLPATEVVKNAPDKQSVLTHLNEALAQEDPWPSKATLIQCAIDTYHINPNDMHNSRLNIQGFPLFKAVQFNDVVFAHYLIEHKANPNASGNEKLGGPLEHAQSLDMMDLLLTTGARITDISNYGALFNEPLVILLLYKYGFNFSSQHLLNTVKTAGTYDPEAPRKKNLTRMIAFLIHCGVSMNGDGIKSIITELLDPTTNPDLKLLPDDTKNMLAAASDTIEHVSRERKTIIDQTKTELEKFLFPSLVSCVFAYAMPMSSSMNAEFEQLGSLIKESKKRLSLTW